MNGHEGNPLDEASSAIVEGQNGTTPYDAIGPVTVQTSILCKEQNCMLRNACIESPKNGKQTTFVIRLFGNNSHVESIQTLAEGHQLFKGYREFSTFGFAGMENKEERPIRSHSTAALTNRFVQGNCGHDLGDEAVAIFRLMRLFPDPPARLLHFYLASKPSVCDKVLTPLAVQLYHSNRPLLETMCYSRVYVGTRGVNYMSDYGTWPNRQATLEDDMKAFRSLYYKQAGVSSSVRMDTIVIMEKRKGTHLSNIANRYEIMDYLRKEFPTYQVVMVTWSDYNITEQIQLMSRTRAMISLPGSDVMNGIFLQDGGVLLMYCRIVDPERNVFDPSNEKIYWFDRVS